ncbi:hypothetical protein CHISP_1671 [Chitinispirillum alkaliphilum]|nr:hypothetical protein CHISP_1671 [Chitinispirillum alkaliphilum]
MFQPWISLLAGLWAFFSSFSAPLLVPLNFIITGLVLAVMGFWRVQRTWQGVVNGILGLWLVFSGFVPALQTQTNLLTVGVAAVIIAAWRISETRAPRRHAVRGAR